MARILAHIATLVATVPAMAADATAGQFIAFEDGPAGADEPVRGILKTDVKAGDPGAVIEIGHVELEAATAIAKGALVYSDADGKPTSAGADNPVGRAIRAAANPGDIVEILIR